MFFYKTKFKKNYLPCYDSPTFSNKVLGKELKLQPFYKFHLAYWQFLILLAINNLSGFLPSIRHLADKISTDNISDSTVQIGHSKNFILIIFQTLSLKINIAPQISQRRNGILILFKNSFKTFGIFFPSSVKKIIDFFQ